MTISSIIGADKTLIELQKIIDGEKNFTVQLIGPSGRGKSWIAASLMEHHSDSNNCFINLSGDLSRKSESYYPFRQFVEKKDRTRSKGLTVVKESIGELPYVGKGIQVLIKDYDFKRHKKTIQDISPFKEHLDFSLHILGLHRKYNKVIIICDDVEEFDEKTISYFSDLKEAFSQINEPFNFSFMLISNSNADFKHFFGFGTTYEIKLAPLKQSQINELIQLWCGRGTSSDQLSIVNSCSGGHLTLIKLVADHLREANEIDPDTNVESFFRTVIDSRLRKHKDQYDLLKNLLQSILKSGKPSTTYEMLCLLGDESNIRELIQQAVQMDLLVVRDNYIHFTHPIIENYVEFSLNKTKISFYDQLGLCIRKLTPSNYSRRAFIEQLSGNSDKADTYWALAAIKKMREGSFAESRIIRSEITASYFGNNIGEALAQFYVSYELSFKGEIDNTLLEIEHIPNTLPIELVAEKNFLKCENLAKKISNAPKEDALLIISNWEEIKDTEPEIWYRLMQLRIIISSELGLMDLAKTTEAEVVKYFSARMAYDIHARSILEKLNLFSEVIYTPEIAHRKMLQAEKWLSKELDHEQFHKIIDLFIARTNLSSNSILIDDMEKSIYYATGAISLAEKFPDVPFPGVEAPLSNYYLALVWKDINNLADVVEGYHQIYLSSYIEENKILFDINYAGLLLLNKQTEASLDILKKGTYIPDTKEDDNYYCYYYWSNYCLVTFLSGNVKEARKLFLTLESIAENVSVTLKKYYVRHFEIMEKMFRTTQIKSIAEVERHFASEQPVFGSKMWDRFKLGYLLTDIQIWTSS